MVTRKLANLSVKQWAGFICLYLAGLGWLADLILPFTALPDKYWLFAISLGFAETMFLAGVALLGQAYYRQIHAAFVRLARQGRKP